MLPSFSFKINQPLVLCWQLKYDQRVEDGLENTCKQETNKNGQILSNLGAIGNILEKIVQADFANQPSAY